MALTAFIAGLGLQSKDFLVFVSKNPHASMAKVLAKADKYINSEEVLQAMCDSSIAPNA